MSEQTGGRRQALILDFDGVVVETESLHFECWKAAFAELLDLHLPGDHRQLVGLSLAQIFALWQQRAQGPAVEIGPSVRQAVIDRKTQLFLTLGADRLQPMPGLLPLIRRAQDRGWYVMIASRARRRRMLATLEILGLPAIFDLVMGSEDLVDPITQRKDHTRAAAPFGISGHGCTVIEDSLSGVQEARACGIGEVIGLTSSLDRQALLAAGAHRVVDHLDQVLAS